jgi:flagellar hook-associated protein 1 FlgK
MSTFTGIITALSSLQAHMQAMDTAGHNVANVNTLGYRRQEVRFSARGAYPSAGSAQGSMAELIGNGVTIDSIRRAQDEFLNLHFNSTGSELSRWTTAQNALKEIESIIAPGPGLDLGATMDKFWDAWQFLSTNPEDMSARSALRAKGIAVASSFRDLVQRLRWSASNIDSTIENTVEEINRATNQIAGLNRDISLAFAEGRQPNDLLDQRDVLFQRIAEITGATLITPAGGQPILNLNGKALVQGNLALELKAEPGASGYMEVKWADDGSAVVMQSGELAGKFQVRDQMIPQYLSQLDAMAAALVSQVNALHEQGFGLDNQTDLDFFTPGTSAANIAVDDAILNDVRAIATAAAADSPGDGSMALAIAALRTQPVMAGGISINQAWQYLYGSVGNDVTVAEDYINSAQLIHDQLSSRQQSISGVSLDEEMAQMIQYQHAYDAAARVLTVADEMLGTIIEQMGVH